MHGSQPVDFCDELPLAHASLLHAHLLDEFQAIDPSSFAGPRVEALSDVPRGPAPLDAFCPPVVSTWPPDRSLLEEQTLLLAACQDINNFDARLRVCRVCLVG